MAVTARNRVTLGVAIFLAACGGGADRSGGVKEIGGEVAGSPATRAQVVVPQPVGETPGATAGEFSVGATGAATYTIPVVMAPAAVTLPLSISYSSHAGNGIFGHGFTLQGLSAITRCAQTIAQDGPSGAFRSNNDDRFCLDGQRLVAVAGAYGADGTQYRTEIEGFSKIVSYGHHAGGPTHFRVWTKSGEIMDYGTAADASGEVPATAVVRTWALKRMSDRKQNYLEISYFKDSALLEMLPIKIRYGGNSATGLLPAQQIVIHYEGRPDVAPTYSNGAQFTISKRVLRIETFDGANRVRDYVFAYDQGGLMGRSRLVSVRECGGPDGAQLCFKPTTFTWKNVQVPGTGLAGWGAGMVSGAVLGDYNGDGRTDFMQVSSAYAMVSLSTGGGFANFASWGHGFYGPPKPADLNGDGRTDLLDIRTDGTAYAWISTGSGFTTSVWGSYFPEASRVQFGDFNGDGRADAIAFRAEGDAWVWISGGSSASGPVVWGLDTGGTLADLKLGDFDGDGRTDVLRVQGGSFRVWQSLGNQFAAHGAAWGSNPYVTSVGLHAADVNGDGNSDIVWFGGGHAYVWLSTGKQFTDAQNWGAGFSDKDTLADMNGDGRADVLQISTADVKVAFSSGKNFIAFMPLSNVLPTAPTQQVTRVDTRWHTRGGYYLNTYDDFRVGPEITCQEFGYAGSTGAYNCGAIVRSQPPRQWDCDWEGNCKQGWGAPCTTYQLWSGEGYDNHLSCPGYTIVSSSVNCGDSNCDVKEPMRWDPPVAYRHNGGWHNTMGWDGVPRTAYGQWWCAGEQYVEWLDCWKWVYPNETINFGMQFGDFDGDGLTDVMQLGPGATMQVGRNNTGVADQLTGVVDGLANNVSVIYSPINNPAVHSPEAAAIYPNADLRTGVEVVHHTFVTNPAGGVSQTSYAYGGAKRDAHGRGFLGFNNVTARDQTAQIATATYRATAFPHTGMVSYMERRAGASHALIAQAWNSFTDLTSFGGTVHLPVQTATTEKTWDLNGVATQTVNTSSSDFFYGNPRTVVVATSDGASTDTFTKTTTSQYAPADEANWTLLRLTEATVTSSAPGVPSLTRTTSYSYYPDGLIKDEIREPNDPELRLTTTHQYDAFGNEIKTTLTPNDGSTPRSSRKVYSADGRFPIESFNALEHKTIRSFDGRFGHELSVADPNGLVTSYQYDHLGRRMAETKPDGLQITTSVAFCTGATCPAGAAYVRDAAANRPAPRSRTYFNKQDMEIGTATEGFDGRWIAALKTLDSLGRVTDTTRPYFALGDGFSPETGTALRATTQYDALGRPTVTVAADGSSTTYMYSGRATRVTNAKGQHTTTHKNAAGQVVHVTDPAGRSMSYQHDAHGNVTHSFDPLGFVVITDFDRLGRKKRLVDPDAGTWTYGYNGFGEIAYQVNARGQTTQMNYDQLGRLTSRTEVEGTSYWYFDSDASGKKILGKVSQEYSRGKSGGALGSSRRFFYYDALMRLSTQHRRYSGQHMNMQSTYDGSGRLATVTYPGGVTIQHGYNARGYLESLTRSGSTTPYWQALAANADGQITQEKLGNGLTTTRTYDPATGRVTSIETPANGGSLSCVPAACAPDTSTWNPTTQRDAAGCAYDPDAGRNQKLPDGCSQSTPQSYHVSFDDLGNLEQRRDAVTGLTETFGYDELNRLTNVAGGTQKSFAYDEIGRITFKSDVGNYTYGSVQPHAVKGVNGAVNTTFAYDAGGNMTSGHGRLLTWTSFDKPLRVSNAASFSEWTYDIHHDRMRQRDSTGKTTFYFGDYEQVHAATGGVVKTYRIRTPNGIAAEIQQTQQARATVEKTRYLLTDHLGSIQVATDEAGAVIQRLSYDAHGKRRYTTGADDTANTLRSKFTNRGFTGHETLDDLGLVHMNARLYDPLIGRFLSADQVVQFPHSTQGYDRYQYSGNNPLSYVDPTGRGFLKKIWRTIAAIAVAIVVAVVAPVLLPAAFLQAFPAFVPIVAGFAGGLVAGGFKGAVMGALSGGLFHGIGTALMGTNLAVRVAVHGVASGALAEMQGGQFKHGFISGAFRTAAFIGVLDKLDGLAVQKVIASAVVGGVASKLAGGKFENGAVTAAFATMFNDLAHPSSPEENAVDAQVEDREFTPGEELFVEGVVGVASLHPLGRLAVWYRSFMLARGARGGWKVGDDIYAATKRGDPSWTTVRNRYWKNEAAKPGADEKWGADNVARMGRGRAPQRYNPDKGGIESMELSHEPIPARDGGRAVVPRWPQDHAAVDPFRHPGY